MTNAKKVELGNDNGAITVTLNGATVTVNAEGHVDVLTNKSIQIKPAAEAPAQNSGGKIGLDENLSTVTLYDTTIQLGADGGLTIYTDSSIDMKSVPAFNIGDIMKDGTIYAGISPDTNRPMYAAPEDASIRLTFDNAAKYAQGLVVGDKKDFRVPSKAELKMLAQNLDKGALKGTFYHAAEGFTGCYWSSSADHSNAGWAVRISTGDASYYAKSTGMSLRCIRS